MKTATWLETLQWVLLHGYSAVCNKGQVNVYLNDGMTGIDYDVAVPKEHIANLEMVYGGNVTIKQPTEEPGPTPEITFQQQFDSFMKISDELPSIDDCFPEDTSK